MTQFDRTLEFIDRIQGARNQNEICSTLLEVTRPFGMTALMAGTVPSAGTPADEQRSHVILCEWPVEWLERYVARNYVEHDPLVAYMKRSPAPVKWNEAADSVNAGPIGRRVYGDAGEFGLHDGLAFPLMTLDNTAVLVSLGGDGIDLSPEEFSIVSLVATYAIGRAMQLGTARPVIDHRPELTSREIECIRWAALGKSEWEISQILGISEHTSEKHLLNAKAKLGAVNRVQAVAEAIRQGYIM
ncbi:autoinducer binding domain-containing protein [Aquibium sp. A9E412]|uniref:LuxR family transcriptional regulator n=1 Tax=Aquibium sp. A9E412 TaxID=2976767 RepID=UPI0025AFC4AF|nr:autoinducer binding domain-containing protein [Aquibium sp. A9E412]MDN2568559.1 autoinducer binding domain-containing protein [Aquibium sp. A9E412]